MKRFSICSILLLTFLLLVSCIGLKWKNYNEPLMKVFREETTEKFEIIDEIECQYYSPELSIRITVDSIDENTNRIIYDVVELVSSKEFIREFSVAYRERYPDNKNYLPNVSFVIEHIEKDIRNSIELSTTPIHYELNEDPAEEKILVATYSRWYYTNKEQERVQLPDAIEEFNLDDVSIYVVN